jgi:hypothetical protein
VITDIADELDNNTTPAPAPNPRKNKHDEKDAAVESQRPLKRLKKAEDPAKKFVTKSVRKLVDDSAAEENNAHASDEDSEAEDEATAEDHAMIDNSEYHDEDHSKKVPLVPTTLDEEINNLCDNPLEEQDEDDEEEDDEEEEDDDDDEEEEEEDQSDTERSKRKKTKKPLPIKKGKREAAEPTEKKTTKASAKSKGKQATEESEAEAEAEPASASRKRNIPTEEELLSVLPKEYLVNRTTVQETMEKKAKEADVPLNPILATYGVMGFENRRFHVIKPGKKLPISRVSVTKNLDFWKQVSLDNIFHGFEVNVRSKARGKKDALVSAVVDAQDIATVLTREGAKIVYSKVSVPWDDIDKHGNRTGWRSMTDKTKVQGWAIVPKVPDCYWFIHLKDLMTKAGTKAKQAKEVKEVKETSVKPPTEEPVATKSKTMQDYVAAVTPVTVSVPAPSPATIVDLQVTPVNNGNGNGHGDRVVVDVPFNATLLLCSIPYTKSEVFVDQQYYYDLVIRTATEMKDALVSPHSPCAPSMVKEAYDQIAASVDSNIVLKGTYLSNTMVLNLIAYCSFFDQFDSIFDEECQFNNGALDSAWHYRLQHSIENKCQCPAHKPSPPTDFKANTLSKRLQLQSRNFLYCYATLGKLDRLCVWEAHNQFFSDNQSFDQLLKGACNGDVGVATSIAMSIVFFVLFRRDEGIHTAFVNALDARLKPVVVASTPPPSKGGKQMKLTFSSFV